MRYGYCYPPCPSATLELRRPRISVRKLWCLTEVRSPAAPKNKTTLLSPQLRPGPRPSADLETPEFLGEHCEGPLYPHTRFSVHPMLVHKASPGQPPLDVRVGMLGADASSSSFLLRANRRTWNREEWISLVVWPSFLLGHWRRPELNPVPSSASSPSTPHLMQHPGALFTPQSHCWFPFGFDIFPWLL